MDRLSKLSVAAVALFALHLLSIAILSAGRNGYLTSDVFQFVIGLLAAAACYWTGRRVRAAARWFWLLLSSWCALWCFGQLLLLYYGYYGPTLHNTAPQFLTFFFSATPLFVAIFLVSEDPSQRLHLDNLLDAIQVFVVLSAAYLFFIYVPGTVSGERAYLALRLNVLNVRNILLTVGFTAKALSTNSKTIRGLFLPLGVIMGIYTLGTWVGNHADEFWQIPENWYDLAWSLPFTLVTIAAASWRDQREPLPDAVDLRGIPGPVLVYSAPLFLPLLVLLPGVEAMRAKLTVAAIAVAASFACYSARLIIVQRRERDAIEALARAEEQLRQSQKMEAIGTLAGGVAHDFNNLLTVISGYSELALGSITGGQERKWLEEIDRSAKRGADLVRQLLAFSRRQILQPRVLDLNRVLDGMRDMLQRLIGAQVDINMSLQSHLPAVRADQGKIEQVIMNLSVNARDAMPPGGRLTISTVAVAINESSQNLPPTLQPGSYVVLTVKDTGTGMDEATRARIFEPFFTTKELGRGTGLGLSTVYGIIKQSGGWISVASQPGAGTTFDIYLPQVTGDEELTEAATAPRLPAASAAEGQTLLLVEDDAEIRELAHKILQMNHYRVLDAANSSQAEELNAEFAGDIALVISDVVVPGGDDGPSLVKKLLARRPALKVLYVSGYTRDRIVDNGALSPGKNFLQKPFTPAELTAKVREVLNASATPLV